MSKPHVFISCRLNGDAVDRLRDDFELDYRDEPVVASPAEVLERSRNADALISQLDDPIDATFMQACAKLKVIANVAVGYDNIDVEQATKRKILVLNTPGVLTNATADLAFSLILATTRRIVEADRYIRAGNWVGWSAGLMLGHELSGKTLGIVGMGRIGEAVAKRAAAFGMNIVYTRRGNEEKDSRLRSEYSATRTSLGELLAQADFISLHSPLTKETKNLIGKTEFARMKSSCILINTARGAIVDQTAMIHALKNGEIAGAGLDVFLAEPEVPKELLDLENVVLTPHIGSATVETKSAMSELACGGMASVFRGILPANAVNPEVWDLPSCAEKPGPSGRG